jgi:hypothetical protein
MELGASKSTMSGEDRLGRWFPVVRMTGFEQAWFMRGSQIQGGSCPNSPLGADMPVGPS